MQLFSSIHIIFFIVTTINIASNYLLTFYFSAKLDEQSEQHSVFFTECEERNIPEQPDVLDKQDRGG